MRSNGSDCPTLCILPLLRGCGKINGSVFLLGLRILISSLFMKIERKRGKACNALVTFVKLTVVNAYGSPNEILFVDLLFIPTLLSQNLKRVIPPRTGLLRLAHSSPFFQVLGKPFQGEDICKEIYTGAFPETDKGRQLSENGLEA
jgi:hypothetical protein